MPIEVKMWQARDGQTFPTEVEALRHELQKEVESILEGFQNERWIELETAQSYFRTRPAELKKVIQYFSFLAGNIPEPTYTATMRCPKCGHEANCAIFTSKENSNEPR